jgi:uncharacterized membrane protein
MRRTASAPQPVTQQWHGTLPAMLFRELAETTALAIEVVGVLVIVTGAAVAALRQLLQPRHRSYQIYRQDLGRSILLGLEFLVAGDIIRTVAVSPTLDNVLVLGLIVLIRTFLSIALQVELEGRWPWQSAPGSAKAD